MAGGGPLHPTPVLPSDETEYMCISFFHPSIHSLAPLLPSVRLFHHGPHSDRERKKKRGYLPSILPSFFFPQPFHVGKTSVTPLINASHASANHQKIPSKRHATTHTYRQTNPKAMIDKKRKMCRAKVARCSIPMLGLFSFRQPVGTNRSVASTPFIWPAPWGPKAC